MEQMEKMILIQNGTNGKDDFNSEWNKWKR